MVPRLAAAVPAALLLSLSLTACGGEDPAADPVEADTTTSSATDSTSAAATESCDYADAGSSAVEGIEPPPAEPAVSGEVPVTLETSVGAFGLTLDADRAPCTVGSFVSLVEQGYYDGTSCHRLTAYEDPEGQNDLKVLQCGDPTGTGTGGPGYTIPDELTGDESYPAGTLAMAKTNLPDSGGSQFFLVYADSALPPEYTVFGTADDATVKEVAAAAEDGSTPPTDGKPNTAVDIESATVSD